MVPSTTMIQDDWKLICYYEYERYELFNLARDLSEQTVRFEQEPELAKAMLARLEDWVNRVEAPVPAPSVP